MQRSWQRTDRWIMCRRSSWWCSRSWTGRQQEEGDLKTISSVEEWDNLRFRKIINRISRMRRSRWSASWSRLSGRKQFDRRALQSMLRRWCQNFPKQRNHGLQVECWVYLKSSESEERQRLRVEEDDVIKFGIMSSCSMMTSIWSCSRKLEAHS